MDSLLAMRWLDKKEERPWYLHNTSVRVDVLCGCFYEVNLQRTLCESNE